MGMGTMSTLDHAIRLLTPQNPRMKDTAHIVEPTCAAGSQAQDAQAQAPKASADHNGCRSLSSREQAWAPASCGESAHKGLLSLSWPELAKGLEKRSVNMLLMSTRCLGRTFCRILEKVTHLTAQACLL